MTEPELQHARRPHMDQFHAEQRAINTACTRRTCTVAEAVSWEALGAKYPQVQQMLAENNRLRDAAGDAVVTLEGMSQDLVPLWSMKARLLLEAAEKLRAAMAR